MNYLDLFRVSPYEGLTTCNDKVDLQGWGSNSPVFDEIISAIKPKLVCEIGTWKGGSAATIAKALKKHCSGAKLVCIDTWLGSLEFWLNKEDEERFGGLQLKNGYPQVYYTFLNNMLALNLNDIVIPFPVDSATACNWFKKKEITPDLIYIDASHEYHEVKNDIQIWFEALKLGGFIIGDDYNESWPGVIKAVNWAINNIKGFNFVRFKDEKWIAVKN